MPSIMRCILYSLLFFFSLKLFGQTTVILGKNVTVPLDILISEKQTTPFPTFSLQELFLNEGSILSIDKEVFLNSKKITLKQNSAIYTLGNSIHIKATEFDSLGKIDTRFKNHDGANGEDGFSPSFKAASAILHCNKNCGNQSIDNPNCQRELAEKAKRGTSGGKGQDGKNAGSIFLTVKKFRGGSFIADGGKGGEGGRGGKGEDGGDGYRYESPNQHNCRAEWHRGISIDDLINATDGGRGGSGGEGGTGGKGGNIVIACEEFNAIHGINFFPVYDGGEGGDSNEGGIGGEGGKSGMSSVWRLDKYKELQGRSGNKGDFGPTGKSGNKGERGSLQIHRMIYEETE